MSDARGSLLAWLERRGGSIEDYAFPSRIDHTAHMSTRQYARLVDEWVTAVGLRSEDYGTHRSEEHTSELQSLMRISYAVFCLKKKTKEQHTNTITQHYNPSRHMKRI